MCDFNKIAGLILAAQAFYLAVLVMLATAVVLSGSFFGAGGNVPLMIAAMIANGLSLTAIATALVEVDKCRDLPCGPNVSALHGDLVVMLAAFGTFGALLTGLALVAWIPFAGAVAAATVLGALLTFGSVFASASEVGVAAALRAFNACVEDAGGSGNDTAAAAVGTVAMATFYLTVIAVVAGGLSGHTPWHVEVQF